MSRWTIANLVTMSAQEIFNLVGYHILVNKGQVRDVLIRPENRKWATRRWKYIVQYQKAPATHKELIGDLDRIARCHPQHHAQKLIECAHKHGLEL